MERQEDDIDFLIKRFVHPLSSDDPRAIGMAREQALFQLFAKCGFKVRDLTRERTVPLDGAFEADFEGKKISFALEVKGVARREVIRKALQRTEELRKEAGLDRALVVFSDELPPEATRYAQEIGLGTVDALGVSELRSWLWKNVPWEDRPKGDIDGPTCAVIIDNAMKAIALRLSRAPDEINKITWLDLERVLREVFDGMGFDTTLTRSTKDGGFDLSLEIDHGGEMHRYLVEVKHWLSNKPGSQELAKLVHVTAREQARKGILLSSSGFTSTVYEGITEAERKTVGLGAGSKIIALCHSYYRLSSPLWAPAKSNIDLLLADLQ
ncbi:hypothetical protein GFB56_35950 [Ensifer sp. T173]|uniref:Restriction endonuclease type IV Mrr domain-containing protein n=1 Tax=Ensifer canadensis TaxID=555315 RepID=A0AAW4FX68_9HYPH|nr:restriction endonuclease [Ensifer canadensis]MBM3096066.1 hypothetical protein [Ensifer canadensis]UBI73968.1 restriction endonuclease [Ensifer canadensis]